MKGGHNVGKLEEMLNAAQIGMLPPVAKSRRACLGGSMFGHQCVKLLPVPRTTPLRRRSDGLADFDVAATRDSRPRTLTLDLHPVRRRPAAHHIEFQT